MGEILDDPRLRERRFVFTGRHDAGQKLGEFIRSHAAPVNPVVLAIPAGGIPIGVEVARAIGAPFGLAVVRKIRIPGTTESGFGAVTWDGKVLVNERLRAALGLTPAEVEIATAETKKNVVQRIAKFTGGKSIPPVAGKTVILTDDGLASGFTMLAAIRCLREKRPLRIVVAVPTGSGSATELVAREADQMICLNIRTGRQFAVAEAYEEWYDLDDREVEAELAKIKIQD